jgi:hypothetical protein
MELAFPFGVVRQLFEPVLMADAGQRGEVFAGPAGRVERQLSGAGEPRIAESGVGRGPDRGVGVEARIGRYGAAISERLSPARISASYAPGSASTIDSTASKGARSAPSRWCRPARNPGEL